jgi:oxalate decarboxylase/phosphoglucose isomerase-like protein (cupin superfamily)
MDVMRARLTPDTEPLPADENAPASPQGEVPNPYSFAASTMPAKQFPGGTVKIVDSTVFKAATQVAFAEVTIEPGHMRELHVRSLPSLSVHCKD